MLKNIFYAQSGGVTAVINATAQGVMEAARKYPKQIKTVLAGKNGILGALHEELYDTHNLSADDLKRIGQSPGGVFGSCRYKLKALEQNRSEYQRLIEVFAAHNIGYFLYNGGGDSQDTTLKISQMADLMGYPLTCIGIPKTIDNDLPFTDSCPGFGSVAKYVAISTLEASMDVVSMAGTSTKVFILEVMGRHAGWIAASAGLIKQKPQDPPHIICFPEVPFETEKFLNAVEYAVKTYGYCTVVASEGLRDLEGRFLSEIGATDAFGHAQLGGIAPFLSALIRNQLNLKSHWAVSDYLQRSARHIASKVDVQHAYELGKAAVKLALKGKHRVMLTLERLKGPHYDWQIGAVDLTEVANQEKHLPENFISNNGFEITPACKRYLQPLIQGEAYPEYSNGLPQYHGAMKLKLIKKKLGHFEGK